MPSANRMTTPVAVDEAEIEGRYAPLGDYTVAFETFKQEAEKNFLVQQLREHDWNVSETARRLNMHRRTLQRILAKRAPR